MTNQFLSLMKLKEGFNPIFPYENKKIVLLSDCDLGENLENMLQNHVRHYDFEISDTKIINVDRLRSLSYDYAQKDDILFERIWDWIEVPINIERLKHYTQIDNHIVFDLLSQGVDVKLALKESANQISSQEDNIHVFGMIDELEAQKEQFKEKYLLLVLNNHKVFSPLSVEQSGELSYHFIGKGNYYFGANNSLNGRLTLGNHYAMVPLSMMNDQEEQTSTNFAKEIFNHEFIGHGFLGLVDHFDMNPAECVMATKRSKSEYVEISKKYDGLYFCDVCSKRVI